MFSTSLCLRLHRTIQFSINQRHFHKHPRKNRFHNIASLFRTCKPNFENFLIFFKTDFLSHVPKQNHYQPRRSPFQAQQSYNIAHSTSFANQFRDFFALFWGFWGFLRPIYKKCRQNRSDHVFPLEFRKIGSILETG